MKNLILAFFLSLSFLGYGQSAKFVKYSYAYHCNYQKSAARYKDKDGKRYDVFYDPCAREIFILKRNRKSRKMERIVIDYVK